VGAHHLVVSGSVTDVNANIPGLDSLFMLGLRIFTWLLVEAVVAIIADVIR
jgi:hypothetical protein